MNIPDAVCVKPNSKVTVTIGGKDYTIKHSTPMQLRPDFSDDILSGSVSLKSSLENGNLLPYGGVGCSLNSVVKQNIVDGCILCYNGGYIDKYICDSCMETHVYKGYTNIMVTDERTAIGDKLRMFSSIGRYLSLKADRRVHYFGDSKGYSADCVSFDKRHYSPMDYTDVFSGAYFAPHPRDYGYYYDAIDSTGNLKVFTDAHKEFVRGIVNYIEANEIQAFYCYNFPFYGLLDSMLNSKHVKCEVISDYNFFHWGASGRPEFKKLNYYIETPRMAQFLSGIEKPILLYHCRQRPWTGHRNADLRVFGGAMQMVQERLGGTVVRIGLLDEYYKAYNNTFAKYIETAPMYLSLDEQFQLVHNALVMVDIHSVPSVMAGELGIPLLHVDKENVSSPNCIEGRYLSIPKNVEQGERATKEEIYNGVLKLLGR